jgi:hypothetical protein
MVLGFNHNVRYRDEIFHVQTEDSGLANPHIVTLIYRGGTIIASDKTSYADIVKIENLEHIVEELMKDQHKGMMRRLKNGEFDDRAFPGDTGRLGTAPSPQAAAPAERSPCRTAPVPEAAAARTMDDILLDYLAAKERE